MGFLAGLSEILVGNSYERMAAESKINKTAQTIIKIEIQNSNSIEIGGITITKNMVIYTSIGVVVLFFIIKYQEHVILLYCRWSGFSNLCFDACSNKHRHFEFKLPSISQIKDDLYVAPPPQIASGAGDVSTKPLGPAISDSTQSLIDANKMILGDTISTPPDIAAPIKLPIRGGVRSVDINVNIHLNINQY